MVAQRGNGDPRYQWAALIAFSHYLLGQYDASLSWSRETLYLNPTISRGSRCGRRRWRKPAGGKKPEAAEVLLDHYPQFTVERHLRNFYWRRAEDIAHYRDGLVKAGVPYGPVALVARRAAD